MNRVVKLLFWLVGGMVLLVGLIQLVPYGRSHTNPPVVQEPAWDSVQTRELAQRACFDCHSNETDWSPWYASVAPASWLVQRDVDEARRELNFSEWSEKASRGGRMAEEAGEVIREGEMPPAQYLLMHPEADLTAAEKELLAKGLEASLR